MVNEVKVGGEQLAIFPLVNEARPTFTWSIPLTTIKREVTPPPLSLDQTCAGPTRRLLGAPR